MREGDREYFYAQLDRLFPGLKQRYIDAFGLRYECTSPNNDRADDYLPRNLCQAHGILSDSHAVFRYLGELPEGPPPQVSMFDLLDQGVGTPIRGIHPNDPDNEACNALDPIIKSRAIRAAIIFVGSRCSDC